MPMSRRAVITLVAAILANAAIADEFRPARPRLGRPEHTSHILQKQPVQALRQLTSAAPPPPATGLNNREMLALLVGVASLTAAGSVVLLVFASLVRYPIPVRSLVAAVAVACASALLEAIVGNSRRSSFVGRCISETGQALAIASVGWAVFSVLWTSGYISLLTPGRKPLLNAGSVLGCALAAAAYGRIRPASRAQTAVPFAAALVMLHLHLLVTPDVQVPKLAPMAVASAVLALAAVGLDVLVQRAAHSAARSGARKDAGTGLSRVRGAEDMALTALVVNLVWSFLALGECPATFLALVLWASPSLDQPDSLAGPLSLTHAPLGTAPTGKWSFSEAPSWGFVAISASLSATQIGLAAAHAALPSREAQAARHYYVHSVASQCVLRRPSPLTAQATCAEWTARVSVTPRGPESLHGQDHASRVTTESRRSSPSRRYEKLATWLAVLGAWRTLWPDEPSDEGTPRWRRRASEAELADQLRRRQGKRERHYFSLVGAFTLWGLTSAAAGKTLVSALAMGMVLLVVGKTAVASLFGEPLVMAGLLGLAGGAALIGVLVNYVKDENLQ